MHSRLAQTIVLFVLIIAGLFALDYYYESGSISQSFLGNVIQDLFSPSTITEELLKKTSLNLGVIKISGTSADFFSPYLTLPDSLKARHIEIKNTTIQIEEVNAQNPFKVIEALIRQKSDKYEFNRIQQNIFYLNQVPLETKTHNFLAIIINDVLYGFQYKPFDHSKVLELIDALGENQ